MCGGQRGTWGATAFARCEVHGVVGVRTAEELQQPLAVLVRRGAGAVTTAPAALAVRAADQAARALRTPQLLASPIRRAELRFAAVRFPRAAVCGDAGREEEGVVGVTGCGQGLPQCFALLAVELYGVVLFLTAPLGAPLLF